MINVELNDASFTYDVHSLVKAFYFTDEVHIQTEEETGGSFTGFKIYIERSRVICSSFQDGTPLRRQESALIDQERGKVKNTVKRTLYRLLSEVTGQELPWGTLTGIRPIKLPMKLLSEGKTDAEIAAYLQETYLVSPVKIALATKIARREKQLLAAMDARTGYSLYIGIPFCPTTCLYCSFPSYPIERFRSLVGEYLLALKRELQVVARLFAGRRLDSVYIGGGTPTTLAEAELTELVGILREQFDLSSVLEFTVEAGRPDSVTFGKLKVLKDLGVTRISINPQTMNVRTLQIIGRNHTVEQIHEAFVSAREAGHENINMDMILGLPGENEEMVAHTLAEIAKLQPDSLTVHSMAIKRAAGMQRFLSVHEEIKSMNTPEMMEMTMRAAAEMKLQPYYLYRQKNMAGNFENVGYASKGKEGIYNILIMEDVQTIVACGAGTVTKRVDADGGIIRCDNVKDVKLYLEQIEEMIERKRKLFC